MDYTCGEPDLRAGNAKDMTCVMHISAEARSKISGHTIVTLKSSAKVGIRQCLHIIASTECSLKLNSFEMQVLFGKVL